MKGAIILGILITGTSFFYTCSDNEPIIATGDIQGMVDVFTDLQVQRDDASGVEVVIKDEVRTFTTVTDEEGKFFISDFPFGEYQAKPFLDNHVAPYDIIEETDWVDFYHVMDSPTFVKLSICEIPGFHIAIDSLIFPSPELTEPIIAIFTRKINEDEWPLNNYHPMVVYLSDSPDVSSTDHIFYEYGSFKGPDNSGSNYWGIPYIQVAFYYNNISDFPSDSAYVRIYPLPWCEQIPPRPEALGPPSEVTGFRIK